MKRILCQIVLCLSFIMEGCMRHVEDIVPLQVLNDSILSVCGNLHIDTIGTFDDLIYAEQFFVYRDSVLIVQNKRHTDGNFIELYNMHDMKRIRALYKLGDGPEEMLGIYGVAINKDTLYANDFVKKQLAVVDLDTLLSDSAYKPMPIRYLVTGSSIAVPYRGGFLLENPNCFTSEELGIYQDAPRFIVTDGKKPYTGRRKYKYYTRNVVVDGSIITNYLKDRIAYANIGQSIVELYDSDLRLLKKIKGPIDLKANYVIDSDNNVYNEVSYKGAIPYSYVASYADGKHFYLSYIGDFLRKDMQMRQLPGWIFKFDWDGNLVNSYNIGHYVCSISKCGSNLYATILNEEDVPVLLKIHEDEK